MRVSELSALEMIIDPFKLLDMRAVLCFSEHCILHWYVSLYTTHAQSQLKMNR